MAEDEQRAPHRSLEATEVVAPAHRLIGGKYRLGRMLGEGGMGAVYEAEHTGLGIKVAVKLLNEIFATDPSAVSRFRREAKATAAIRHDNIVAVTDTGTDEDGVPFLVMELLEGESLSALLRRERALAPKESAHLACQLLAGLAAAHQKGVIHRDLKPGNIIVSQAAQGVRQVKILDFGISKFFADAAQNVTATGAVVGTPRFMAPEQARAQSDLDARVDIYAVGVLLYRMVTGKLPFSGQTQDEIIAQILGGKPPSPREIREEIPESLEEVILKAMATEREDRYPNARAFLSALQEVYPDMPTAITWVSVSTGPPLDSSTERSADRSTRPDRPQALRDRAASTLIGRRSRWAFVSVIGLAVILGGGFAAYRLLTPDDGKGKGQGGQGHHGAAALGRGAPIRFGMTRYLPRAQLEREQAPLVQYLSQRLGRRVKLVIADDYVDLADKLQRGELELAALSSCDYARAKRRHHRLRLLATHETRSGKSYQGIIVTRAEAKLDTLEDLKGRVFCYVSPKSCSGYLYPRAMFRQAGIDPDRDFTGRIAGDHLRALNALHSGACDGAAVFAGIFYEAEQHGLPRERFHIVASTKRIPYDAYCAPGSLPDKMVSQIKEALLSLKPGSGAAIKALGPSSRITGFVAVKDSAYDPVREVEDYLHEKRK